MFSTTLAPSRAVLCDALNPTVSPITIGTVITEDPADVQAGEFRSFAGDRTQLVSYNSTTTTLQITLVNLNRAQADQVKKWKGDFLLLRTTDGLRMFGGYLNVATKRILNVVGTDGSDVAFSCSIAFQRVTYDESV